MKPKKCARRGARHATNDVLEHLLVRVSHVMRLRYWLHVSRN